MKPKITKKEILDFFYSLSLEEVIKIVKDYDKKHKSYVAEELEKLQLSEVERKLLEAGVNSTCPHCNSNKIVKRGRDVNFQRYFCKDCLKSFTAVTNTFLENTNFPWKVWVSILEMTIHNESIADMVNKLERDYKLTGLTEITVLLARHKILYAVSLLPQPVLTGVIQIDETFFRESQKAAKELVNYIPSVAEYRKPRYGVQPSLLGTMGSEFSNVPVAIDSSGHMVAKVACLGRLTIEIFTDLFHEHIDKPAYICTDANPIYKRYCKLFGIPHYIRPSTYYTDIKKAGYDQPYYPDEELNKAISAENYKILEKLYSTDLSDRIVNKGYLTFKEFQNLKRTYGLSLGAVNKQHSELKKMINTGMTNVSTKYLDRYVSFYVFLHNWKIDHGDRYPSSTKEAEDILIYILQNAGNSKFTLKDLQESKLTLPKPTSKYIDLLAAMTSEARKEFNNKYLKFNEEDKVYNFKKREYLEDCPRSWLEEVARSKGLPYSHHSVSTRSIVNALLKQPDIDTIIVRLLLKEKQIHLEQEDCDLLEFFKLSPEELGYDTPIDENISKYYPPVKEDSPLYNPNAYMTAQQLQDYEDGFKQPEDNDNLDGEDDYLPF